MIGGAMLRFLNTLFCFEDEESGERVCCDCVTHEERYGSRRERLRPVSGTEFYNGGEDPADEYKCNSCGTTGPRDEFEFEESEGVTGYRCPYDKCKSEDISDDLHICDRCGDRLEDHKEE